MSKTTKLTAGSALATGMLFGMPAEAATDLVAAADTVLEIYAGSEEDGAELLTIDAHDADALSDEDAWHLAQTVYGGVGNDGVFAPRRNGGLQGRDLGTQQPQIQTRQPQLQTRQPNAQLQKQPKLKNRKINKKLKKKKR